jgi:hypothetical protein
MLQTSHAAGLLLALRVRTASSSAGRRACCSALALALDVPLENLGQRLEMYLDEETSKPRFFFATGRSPKT